jgi:YVTN family beta-propeller protein
MHQQFIVAVAVLVTATACSSSSDAGATAPAASSHRKAYVGLFGDQSVAVLDTVTSQVLKTIPVSAPDGLIVTPDGKKVYVSSTDTGTVKVIETAGDTIANSIDVGVKPAGIAVTPDGSRVVVSVGGAGEAVIIDTSTEAVLKHVSVAAAHASCISADGHYAYVGSQATGAPAIALVDILGGTPTKSFPVDKSPRMLSCTPGTIYFTAVGLDAVEVMEPTTGSLGDPIASGGSPHDVRATPDGKFELVVSQTAGDLEFIDVQSRSVIAQVPTGKLAHWITLFADGTGAYVTNEGDNNVVTVDLGQRRVTSTIAIGNGPRKMALQP